MHVDLKLELTQIELGVHIEINLKYNLKCQMQFEVHHLWYLVPHA